MSKRESDKELMILIERPTLTVDFFVSRSHNIQEASTNLLDGRSNLSRSLLDLLAPAPLGRGRSRGLLHLLHLLHSALPAPLSRGGGGFRNNLFNDSAPPTLLSGGDFRSSYGRGDILGHGGDILRSCGDVLAGTVTALHLQYQDVRRGDGDQRRKI